MFSLNSISIYCQYITHTFTHVVILLLYNSVHLIYFLHSLVKSLFWFVLITFYIAYLKDLDKNFYLNLNPIVIQISDNRGYWINCVNFRMLIESCVVPREI